MRQGQGQRQGKGENRGDQAIVVLPASLFKTRFWTRIDRSTCAVHIHAPFQFIIGNKTLGTAQSDQAAGSRAIIVCATSSSSTSSNKNASAPICALL